MSHCVGEYCEDVEKGNSVIYSLRDPKNNPKVTIETDRNGKIVQIQGNSNSEPEQIYKDMIKEWISTKGEESGIDRRVNTMEQLEESHYYQSPDVKDVTKAIDRILQGDTNEYGLKYILDEGVSDVAERLLETGKNGQKAYYGNRDKDYTGDITDASTYPVYLAMMEDLKMDHWPHDHKEWNEFRKMPKKSDWKNIRELQKWAWDTLDDIIEKIDVYSYDTGVDFPNEEDYEDPAEFEKALEQAENYEAEVHDEWIKNTIEGGFSKDILDDINKYMKEGWIPSMEELHAITESEQAAAVNKAFSKKPAMGNPTNWYKKC